MKVDNSWKIFPGSEAWNILLAKTSIIELEIIVANVEVKAVRKKLVRKVKSRPSCREFFIFKLSDVISEF